MKFVIKVAEIYAQKWLLLRRKTTTAQQEPHRAINKMISYILHVCRLSRQHNYQSSCIVAMDEMSVWDDMVSTTTVDDVGAELINLKITEHGYTMLSARADGTKLKPYIVFCGAKREVKKLNEDFKHNCVIATSSNAWLNKELTFD